jgi:hypothetical protein
LQGGGIVRLAGIGLVGDEESLASPCAASLMRGVADAIDDAQSRCARVSILHFGLDSSPFSPFLRADRPAFGVRARAFGH